MCRLSSCLKLLAILILGFIGQAGFIPAAQAEAGPQGSVFRDCPDCPEMVVVPAGHFIMGSPIAETTRENVPAAFAPQERPQHDVTIGHNFALGKYLVTQGEFAAFVEKTGYDPKGCFVFRDGKYQEDKNIGWRVPGFEQTERDPVICVSYADAQHYVAWLNQKLGASAVSAQTGPGPYRLPTEAEWEYAARAGTVTAHYWGDSRDGACDNANIGDLTAAEVNNWTISPDIAFQCRDGYAHTAPVGKFHPNGFGLYDMLGNAWEWTADCWHENYSGAPGDGSAWISGDCNRRVRRGGSWYMYPRVVRAASRVGDGAATRNYLSGFRLARTLP